MSVTLYNEGQDAFESSVYGNSITIQRHIPKGTSGYNGFKLLDSQGKEKSRSKAVLTKLLDHLNIQVDNPVAVLDQEEAKKFLTGQAKDKYGFFIKATELERMDHSHANVVDNIHSLTLKKEQRQRQLQPSIDQTKKLRELYMRFQRVRDLEEKCLQLELCVVWAHFQDFEQDVEVARKVSACFGCYCIATPSVLTIPR